MEEILHSDVVEKNELEIWGSHCLENTNKSARSYNLEDQKLFTTGTEVLYLLETLRDLEES